MLTTIAILFAVAAAGGLVLAMRHFQGKSMPTGLAVLHGLLAATALVLLLIGVLNSTIVGSASTALILFVVAALGGFALVSYHIRKKRHPSALILIHGGVAVIAFVLLLLGIFSI